MKHPFHIVRPLNLSLIAATMLLVLIKYKNGQVEDYWLNAILLILPAVLTAAAGYVINDIYDVETDAINKPPDCIIGLSMKKSHGWYLYATLTIVSLLISFLFSKQYGIINTCIIGMLYLYSTHLKGMALIGNIVVAICSSAVIACCILLITFETKAGFINFTGYMIFAFFISLIREIVKDVQDYEGDKACGIKTYAVMVGVKGAKIMIYTFTAIEIILCGIYSFICWGIDLYSASILMGIITLSLFGFINFIAKANSKDDFALASKILKYIMFAGVINLIFA